MNRTRKRLTYSVFLILSVILVGTLGYEVIEGWGNPTSSKFSRSGQGG
jgi:hypothetical protein